jgi:hypothetical protein
MYSKINNRNEKGGITMPETIVNLVNKIAAVKGEAYVKGMVDMANLLAPDRDEEENEQETA